MAQPRKGKTEKFPNVIDAEGVDPFTGGPRQVTGPVDNWGRERPAERVGRVQLGNSPLTYEPSGNPPRPHDPQVADHMARILKGKESWAEAYPEGRGPAPQLATGLRSQVEEFKAQREASRPQQVRRTMFGRAKPINREHRDPFALRPGEEAFGPLPEGPEKAAVKHRAKPGAPVHEYEDPFGGVDWSNLDPATESPLPAPSNADRKRQLSEAKQRHVIEDKAHHVIAEGGEVTPEIAATLPPEVIEQGKKDFRWGRAASFTEGASQVAATFGAIASAGGPRPPSSGRIYGMTRRR